MTKAGLITFIIGCFLFYACGGSTNSKTNQSEPTSRQKTMLEEGWGFENPENGDLPSEYGIVPIKGLFDNYFDIEIGEGFSMAMKIVEVNTNKTVRYVYVRENTTANISEIPPGKYYLKLTFGYDWMKCDKNNEWSGKFSKAATYEMSDDVFDFGQSTFGANSYHLKINMVHDEKYENFSTTEINEEEFFNDNIINGIEI